MDVSAFLECTGGNTRKLELAYACDASWHTEGKVELGFGLEHARVAR